jgi:hypothetical protein
MLDDPSESVIYFWRRTARLRPGEEFDEPLKGGVLFTFGLSLQNKKGWFLSYKSLGVRVRYRIANSGPLHVSQQRSDSILKELGARRL